MFILSEEQFKNLLISGGFNVNALTLRNNEIKILGMTVYECMNHMIFKLILLCHIRRYRGWRWGGDNALSQSYCAHEI